MTSTTARTGRQDGDATPTGPDGTAGGDQAAGPDTVATASGHQPAPTSGDAPAGGDAGPRSGRFALWLALVTLGGLAVRVVYVLVWKNPGWELGDAVYYHEGANLLADGEGYIHPYHYIRSDGLRLPGADHPPGYLTALAAFSLLGFRTFLEHQIVSCLLGAAGVATIGLTGRRIAGERVGLLAASIVAVNPNVWFMDSAVMSETLVVATTALVLLTAYRWWDRPTTASACWFGLAVGVSALARSEAALLGVVIAVPLLLWRRPMTWRPRLVQLGAAGGVALVAVAPWVAHNLARFEHPVTLSSQFEQTLVAANCEEVYYGPNTGFWWPQCMMAVDPLMDPLDDASEEAIVFRRVARDYVADHTRRAAVVVGARVGRTFGLYQPENQLDLDRAVDGREKGVGQAGLLAWYGIAVAGAAGLVGLRRAGRPIFPLVAVVGATALTVAVTYGTTRFRLPAELALCIPAAVSLDAALGAGRRRWSAWRAGRGTGARSGDGGGDDGPVDAPPSGAVTALTAAPAGPAESPGVAPRPEGDEPRDRTEPDDGDGVPEPLADDHPAGPDADAGAGGDAGDRGDADPGQAARGSSPDVPGGLGSSGGRFAGFDGLRAIAALGVLLTHVSLASGLLARTSADDYLARADVGVALFFVLSGFLLYRPFVSARLDGRAGPGARRYLRHRLLRILPAYWLALTVLAVVLDVRRLDEIRTPWDFLVYYGLLQSYSEGTALGGLQQAWTLTNELAFYLILPLWAAAGAWLARRLPARRALGVELAVLAAAMGGALGFRWWLQTFQVNDPTTGSFDPRFHWILANFNMFVPGMALALGYEWSRRKERPLRGLEVVRRHPVACWVLAGVCFWAVSTQVNLTYLGTPGPGPAVAKELLYAAVGLLLLAPVALAGGTLPRSLRWLGSRVMVTLGVLSYGIYLWHEGVIDIYRDMRDYESPDGSFLLMGSFPVMLGVVLVGTLAAAALSYLLVERPALALKDRRARLFARWRPVGLPADADLVRVAPAAPSPAPQLDPAAAR
jgi:peptidoglycan/LPS O-acetylase OafA/YrhL/4-amino-4-deoxy-L-arabinose transferase-like glycosyltransferase